MKMILKLARDRAQRKRDEGEQGFTLIELLIVIVVLAILAGVVIFALGGVTGKSNLSACQADGATISTAMSAFTTENPGVTATSAVLVGSTEGGPYVQSWPSSTDFQFSVVGGVLKVAKLTAGVAGTLTTYTGAATCSTVGA